MTYVARVTLIALIVFVLQVTLVHRIDFAGIAPDLMIVLLVALVIDRGPVAAVVIGFCVGFLQDLGNASMLGMNALAKSIIAYGVARIGGSFFPESLAFKGILIGVALLLNDVIVLAVTTSFDIGEIVVSFFRYSLLSGIYTALIGIVVLEVLKLVAGRMVRTRGRY